MRAFRGSLSSIPATRLAAAFALALALTYLTGGPVGYASRGADREMGEKIDLALQQLLSHDHGPEIVRVIIRTRDAALREDLKQRLNARGIAVTADHAFINAISASVHAADIAALAADAAVAGVSLDARVEAHAASTPLLGTLSLPYTSGGSTPTGLNIRVAVIDSGVELAKDLPSTRLLGFYDLTRGDQVLSASAYDDYGHGTHVAGLIAGSGTNSGGYYQGVAPSATILALKVLDQNGAGYTSDVIQAIDYILANQKSFRIDIINLSLGHPIYESARTDPLVLAVQKAAEAGIVVVVAAGNYGKNLTTGVAGYTGITSPGNAPSAITVGAVDIADSVSRFDDSIAPYSSRGPTWYDGYAKPDLVAPGHQLVSVAALKGTLYLNNPTLRVVGKTGDVPRYLRLSGTSMATAVVSGSVALMLELTGKDKSLYTPNLMKALLEWSAIPLPVVNSLTQGAGALNPAGALTLVRSIDPRQPVGAYWFTTSVSPWTSIGGSLWTWGQTVVWGNSIASGTFIDTRQSAWAKTVTWGNTVVWGDTVVWGNNVVWSDPSLWSSTVVWGDNLIGFTDGTTVVWGNTNVTPSTVVWGDLATLDSVSTTATFAQIQQ